VASEGQHPRAARPQRLQHTPTADSDNTKTRNNTVQDSRPPSTQQHCLRAHMLEAATLLQAGGAAEALAGNTYTLTAQPCLHSLLWLASTVISGTVPSEAPVRMLLAVLQISFSFSTQPAHTTTRAAAKRHVRLGASPIVQHKCCL
jgi:hypothetical protein